MHSPFAGDPRTVRRPDYAPRPRRPYYETYRVEPGRTHQLVILSQRLETVLVHAVQGRTQPCTGEGESCWLSHAEYAIRWQGWLWVREACKKSIRTVTVTPYTVSDCPSLLQPDFDLRGRKLTLWRHDRRICSAMHGNLDNDFYALDFLPPVPSMIEHLGTLWSAPPRTDAGKDCPEAIQELRRRFPTAVQNN